jgi:deaminated glutathione amidase
MTLLKVATCQFPVSADIAANLRHAKRQMSLASQRGARVAHFPEGALSGYAGTDFQNFAGFDWDQLREATDEIAEGSRQLGIWVVTGSAHQLTGSHKPHSSLYVISDTGQIVERYDKRFCSGDPVHQSGDLAHYTPGSHFSTWAIDGIRCGALICYDYRFPELYREYSKRGVQLMFHSFHAARASPGRIAAMREAIGPHYAKLNPAATYTYPGITMPAVMTTAAACNHVWISCPNSSARQSLWPSLLCARRRHHHRPATAQHRGSADIGRRHRAGTLRLHRSLAGRGYRRYPPQRHVGQRPSLRRSRPRVTDADGGAGGRQGVTDALPMAARGNAWPGFGGCPAVATRTGPPWVTMIRSSSGYAAAIRFSARWTRSYISATLSPPGGFRNGSSQ